MKDAFINLLKVRSIFSLVAASILILSIFYTVPEWVQSICGVIIAFYFGTRDGAKTNEGTTTIISNYADPEPDKDVIENDV